MRQRGEFRHEAGYYAKRAPSGGGWEAERSPGGLPLAHWQIHPDSESTAQPSSGFERDYLRFALELIRI